MKRRTIFTILLGLALAGAVALNIHCKGNNTISVVGNFHDTLETEDATYYHFKSNDNEVWWLLKAEEMGFVPNKNAEYVLTYDNNGTTKANKPCDCAPKYECECEVYDDEFVSIQRR